MVVIGVIWMILLTQYFTGSIRFNNTQIKSYSRLLLIGDSVDRMSVEDWCMQNSDHMPLTFESKELLSSSRPHSLFEALEKYEQRFSWHPLVCRNDDRRVTLMFLHNKFGVEPTGPWRAGTMTTAGMSKDSFGKNLTIPALWNFAFEPAIEILHHLGGGPPHGVILQSAFWDLALLNNSRVNTQFWLSSWRRNATILRRTVKQHFPKTPWFAWRTANLFGPTGSREWNTNYSLDLLKQMNAASRSNVRREGYDLIEFEQQVYPYGRDHVHPNKTTTGQLGEQELLLFGLKTNHSVVSASRPTAVITATAHGHKEKLHDINMTHPITA